MQWKPKGSCKADSPSDTQDINTAGYMEHQDNVRDRKDRPSSQRNEKIQDQSAWTVWDKMDTVRTAQTLIRRAAAVLRTHRGGSPPYWGVALMLAPEAHAALIGWEPVSSRIITAKFTTKKKDIRLNIIQCYAPTNDAEEEKKDDFYQQLQAVLDRRGAKDITILMGDFNAKIGMDNTGYEDIMGTHGLGQMNENGERFADLCALNQLVIGGSIFPHKRIHKATWISPNHVTENQIDHICISRKFRRSWQDVRVMRGADVSSDHHLLMTTVKLRLKRFTTANSTQQSTMLDCSETRTHKQLSRSAFPTGSSRYKSW